jgi:hypothetical protein
VIALPIGKNNSGNVTGSAATSPRHHAHACAWDEEVAKLLGSAPTLSPAVKVALRDVVEGVLRECPEYEQHGPTLDLLAALQPGGKRRPARERDRVPTGALVHGRLAY